MSKHDVSHLPTILLIDTTDRDQVRLALTKTKETTTLEQPVRAQDLQSLIQELLEKTETSLHDLAAVAVMTGPGSFTGSRIGITAANTLGWLYQLPLIAIAGTDFEAALTQLEHRRVDGLVRVVEPAA